MMKTVKMFPLSPVEELARFLAENGAEIFEYAPRIELNNSSVVAKGDFVAIFDDKSMCVLTREAEETKVLAQFPEFEDSIARDLVENSKYFSSVRFAHHCCGLVSLGNDLGRRVIFTKLSSDIKKERSISVMFRSLIGMLMLSQFHFL